MRRASIIEAKNRLSALLDLVRAGETVTIVDRGRLVARLVPAVGRDPGDDEARIARPERAGVLRPGTGGRVDILLTPPQKARASALEALLEERREGVEVLG